MVHVLPVIFLIHFIGSLISHIAFPTLVKQISCKILPNVLSLFFKTRIFISLINLISSLKNSCASWLIKIEEVQSGLSFVGTNDTGYIQKVATERIRIYSRILVFHNWRSEKFLTHSNSAENQSFKTSRTFLVPEWKENNFTIDDIYELTILESYF